MKRLFKIIISLLLIAASLISCGGSDNAEGSTGGAGAPDDAGTKTSENNVDPQKEERADAMVKIIFDNYALLTGSGDKGVLNLKEYHNKDQSGYLWSNFCGVGMQYYYCKLHPEDETQKTVFRQMINNFKYFRQVNPSVNKAENSVKYHSGRGPREGRGSGDCFFDDNIWVARNYLRAYEILGDSWYLEEAVRVNNWVISGWDDKLGGIVWSERGLRDDADEQHLERGLSANACGIIVNAELAKLATTDGQRAFYKEWAEKFYAFCKKMQNLPESYDYWNGIRTVIVNGVRKDGEINRVHYSYNSGSMIIADLRMYDIETDEAKKAEYLKDAKGTAGAAKNTFFEIDSASGKQYCKGDPWFAAILCESYYELYGYEPTLAGRYLALFAKNAEYAYSNRDTKTGLFPYKATAKNTFSKNESYVIHQVGVAEQAVIAALYEKEKN